MTASTAQAWELRYEDRNANSHKFYRCYLLEGGVVVLQWGRIGAVGQWQVLDGGASTVAGKRSEKWNKGYENYSRCDLSLPYSVVQSITLQGNASPDLGTLDHMYRANAKSDSTKFIPTDELSPGLQKKAEKEEAELKDSLLALARRMQGDSNQAPDSEPSAPTEVDDDDSPVVAAFKNAVATARAKKASV